MKRVVLFIVLCLAFLNLSFPQDYHEYEYALVKNLPIGQGPGEFGVIDVKGTPGHVSELRGPSAFCFDNDNNLYIVDDYNHRLVILDKSFNYKEVKSFNRANMGKIEIDSDNNCHSSRDLTRGRHFL